MEISFSSATNLDLSWIALDGNELFHQPKLGHISFCCLTQHFPLSIFVRFAYFDHMVHTTKDPVWRRAGGGTSGLISLHSLALELHHATNRAYNYVVYYLL